MSVEIVRKPRLAASPPKVAWDLDALNLVEQSMEFEILRDGSLLAMQKGAQEREVRSFEVILNFDEVIRASFRKQGR